MKTVFVDGTFKSCPKLIYQLFTIYGVKDNNYFPFVFFPTAQQEQYYLQCRNYKIGGPCAIIILGPFLGFIFIVRLIYKYQFF
jgi:hypothetical protein